MNSFYFWDEMAAKCLKSEHFQEAIQSYKHALESTDENADQASVWANIGNVYLTIQDIPAAVDAFLAASRLDPTSYDFDCILERITANGYLDESAMILAKDMYALESVKMRKLFLMKFPQSRNFQLKMIWIPLISLQWMPQWPRTKMLFLLIR
jgi:tetratricopeptide (TPR) repeat protein